MLRDAGGMTMLTPLRSRLRRGGILYGQMYSLTKEIVDAARIYPFQNLDLRLLALDLQLCNVCTPVFVNYIWRNINKFTTGFKLVRAQYSGALWWRRQELPQLALLRFLLNITDLVLFRNGTLY
ncbi:hypothetical protein BKA60DRAFT_601325 [Fusarium oxysporum]|nr:hypothetical protein BKA60DRAFT_601325 [Fusarium oxysporum]